MASSPTPAIDDAKSERWHSTSSNLPALGATLRAQAIPRPASSSSGAASHDSPISNSVRNLEPPELWVIERIVHHLARLGFDALGDGTRVVLRVSRKLPRHEHE